VALLRNLFGNLTSAIIRLAVTAGALFLCYLFIVRPVLDKADQAIHASGLDQISKTFDSVDRRVQRQIRRSFHATRRAGGDPQRLIGCIRRAHGEVHGIERCTRRF
jgi:hypothetical protein